ncbi:MAG: 23S rRNA (pseudouridine(1915)-N(3))-methyltransferase RlmH [Pseudomonadales bacterium]|nr:23S rRNA (pseudouridine(1915)-N(3))-methyltransferase RlmH [Pseudomonadales bacterium]NNL57327.1 23S rRNA (pseudouridine(1915)-N(3))-methyltransferase RlmH [Pseudomonadales bacterium]
MKITIIAAGKKMPAWVYQCCDDYYQRLPAEYQVATHEIALEQRGKSQSTDVTRTRETQRLLQQVPANDYIIALSENGDTVSTGQFAGRLDAWREQSKNITFVIGGPDGLDFSASVNGLARWPHWRCSLSALTFPHPLVRVILAEQLYRAWSVVAGHPYHRA